ncbi:hypothetical protein IG631_07898 [Alternaria alternata]|nr:hypothetical protein IG631_07898 [Alternaria alternata]
MARQHIVVRDVQLGNGQFTLQERRNINGGTRRERDKIRAHQRGSIGYQAGKHTGQIVQAREGNYSIYKAVS